LPNFTTGADFDFRSTKNPAAEWAALPILIAPVATREGETSILGFAKESRRGDPKVVRPFSAG
jgi:hypothetical protein